MAGILGSSALQTSQANEEVVPLPPVGWVNVTYKFCKFSFINDQDCHVKINGDTNQIYLRAGQGFEINRSDKKDFLISSFIVVEAGITYNYVGQF